MTEKSVALAILFADIAQSTRLYDSIGNTAAYALISACIEIMRGVCLTHNGTVIKTIGDEIMCSFPTAEDAVKAAREMQPAIDRIPATDLSGCKSPDIYVGIDFGPVIQENSDVFGDAVNVAARMVKLASRRQIITTRQVVDLLPGHYAASCRCIDNVVVKGKSEEAPVYEIVWEEEKITVAIKTPSEGKPLIRQRLELSFCGRQFEVSDSRPSISIGRLDQNDIVVDDTRVSRFHARIEYRKEKYVLFDQSTNGTYIAQENADTVLLQRDELLLTDSGMIDLCCAEPTADSPTVIFYKIVYYKASEKAEATAFENQAARA